MTTTIEELLDFAIDREQDAHDFYVELAEGMERPGMQKIFQQFAKEEAGHKKKLQAIKEGKEMVISTKKVTDLKIAEYVVDVKPDPKMSYQDALILAMKREKAAFRLYSDLAGQADEEGVKLAFLALAQEEAKHKLRFEVEYDEVILAEN